MCALRNADAALERADYVASAEKEFADKEAERCRIQSIADATSYQGFRNDVVADYVVTVHAWSDELNTPWSGYQSALANAEQARIQNLGLASVEYATTVATAKYTWSTSVDQAQETAANDLALARHTRDTDLANCRLAADQQATTARLDYARDMASAVTRHDQGTVKGNQEYDGTVVDRQLKYQTDVIAADKTYDNALADDPNSQSAHAAWQTSVNQATAGRTTDLATARQTRATEVAKLDAGLVWQRTTAAERQADTIAQSARGLAEAEKGIQVAYATATAGAAYAQALTIAAQDKAETDTLAAADRKYKLDACDAASSYASAVANQRANYQAAWYQTELTTLNTVLDSTAAPSITYRHDVIAAGAAWAEGVKAAVAEYQEGLFNAAHANQVRLNAAAQRQTDADSTAQKTYDDAQALIDRNWSVAVDTAWATREAGRAVVEANAAEDRVLAQGRYDRALAEADQKYQVDLAAKSVAWAESVATAQRGYNPENWQAYNNSVATADQQLAADRRVAASTRAGRVGQAQIDLATVQGQVQVDRVSARNAVEIDYVKAMNAAASDQSLRSGMAQVLLATSQAGSAAVYTVAVAQSQVALVAATNTIEVTYQRKLADADVGRATGVATAEGTFEIAELDRKVVSTSEWAARAGASEADQLRAAATAARRQWLDTTKPYYVAYVTAQACASADYQNDLAAARRGASAQQAAADVVYTSSTAAAAQARAIGAAGSASGFAGREVILSNAYDLAYAQAEAAFRLTYAKAEKAKAVTLATAEKAYQVTLVGLDPQATNYQTTFDTAQKARAVTQAEATRDWTCARAGADEGWSIGIAKADEAYSKGWAERTYDETVADAKRDGAYSVLVAQAGSVRDVAYAQAQAGLWNQATTLDNARQTRLATAEVAWRDEQYTAQVTVTTSLASTSTTPWAAFQRDLALAQQSWWTTTGASYTASVANANLAATAYQTLVSAAYVAKSQLLATIDLNAAKAQAADALAQTTAIALAEKAHEDGLATARREYLVNMAHALVDQRNLLANAEYKRLAEVSFDYDGSVRSANDERQADEQSAKAAYSTSVAGVEGQYGVGLAQANLKYAQDSAGHSHTWTTGRAAAEKGCSVLEAAAYKTLSITTGALDTAYRRQAAQSQQAAIQSLAQSSATPWSALEAARAAAFADWTGGLASAADIRRTSVATSQANLQVRKAAADAVFAEGLVQKLSADALKEAQAMLTLAQAKAAALVAKAASANGQPPTPDDITKPSVADIVPATEPNSAAYTTPAAKFDATYEAFGLADAPGTVPGYYGYGWNGYGWNGWWGCYGWWYASWWNGGCWYGWYGDGLTESVVRPESIEGEQARAGTAIPPTASKDLRSAAALAGQQASDAERSAWLADLAWNGVKWRYDVADWASQATAGVGTPATNTSGVAASEFANVRISSPSLADWTSPTPGGATIDRSLLRADRPQCALSPLTGRLLADYTPAAQRILAALGNDPTYISQSAVNALVKQGLATGAFFKRGEWNYLRYLIELPQTDGAIDTLVVELRQGTWYKLWFDDCYYRVAEVRCDTPKLAVLADCSLHNQIEHQKMMLYRQSEAQLQAAVLMTPALIELGMAGALASWGGRATIVVVATPIAEQFGVATANIATGRPHETPIAWGTAQALSAAGVDLDTAWFIGRGVDGGVTMAPLIVAAGMEVRGAFAAARRPVVGEWIELRSPGTVTAVALRRAYLNAKFNRSGNLDADINARGIDSAFRVNAELAADYARLDQALGRIENTPGAFGVRAHRYFEMLNNRTMNRVAGTYRVAVEQFRDPKGRIVLPRSAGSIGADVLYRPWESKSAPIIYDLKTYSVVPRPIRPARQLEFKLRFGARSQEIYVLQHP